MIRLRDPRTGQAALIADYDAYHDEMCAACVEFLHADVELRRWTNKNGATAIQAQCLACGGRVGNPVKVTDRSEFPIADIELVERARAHQQARIDAVRIRHIDRTLEGDGEFWSRYDAYLRTPEWKARRAKVLNRCGQICEGCGDAPATVVHHRTYEHVFNELLFELVGLCESCHRTCHPDNERLLGAADAEGDLQL